MVPSATRLLIEDTTKQTLLIYGVLTLIVTLVMRRLIVALTGQAIKDQEQRKRRISELNKQDMLSIGFRIIVLIFGMFYVRPTLIVYLVLPILAFLQNIIDREEDSLIATLDEEQQVDYFQDRNQVWGNSMRRYSSLLRDSMKGDDAQNPDRWRQVMSNWEEHVTKEINRRKQNLSSMNEHDKRRAEAEINRLEKQKQRIATQKAMTERRFSQQKEQELNLPKKRN